MRNFNAVLAMVFVLSFQAVGATFCPLKLIARPSSWKAYLAQAAHLPLPPLEVVSNESILVIGLGPGGIPSVISLNTAGLPVQAVERGPEPGGLWNPQTPHTPLYNIEMNSSTSSTHLGTRLPGRSRYLSAPEALQYLIDTARAGRIADHTAFHTEVVKIEETATGTWIATLRNMSTQQTTQREFRGVIIAAGHYNAENAILPRDLFVQAEYANLHPIHSSAYHRPQNFTGERVLIIGAGNSAFDIAGQLADHAEVTLAIRSTPWPVPKEILGKPADEIASSGWAWYRRLMRRQPFHYLQMKVFRFLQWWKIGHPTSFGMQPPDHDLLDKLPVADTNNVFKKIREGHIKIRPAVLRFGNQLAHYTQEFGEIAPEEFDRVVFATGYRLHYPFLAPGVADFEKGFEPSLLLFHPTKPGLVFMTELTVAQSSWNVFAARAQAAAAYFQAQARQTGNYRRFQNLRRMTNPDFKGPIFRRADYLHVDADMYMNDYLAYFTDWILRDE